VDLVSEDGEAFAKGLTSAGAAEVSRRPRGLEVVHRDRMVVYDTTSTAA
jgi:hypothetical protein